jgi:hypothetical protein
MKRLIDIDPLTRTKTYHEYDHSSGVTSIETVQDIQPFLERNKRLQNDTNFKRQGIKEDWYHFATLPNVFILKLKKEFNLDVFNDDDLPKIEKLLKGSEYKYLRTVDKI